MTMSSMKDPEQHLSLSMAKADTANGEGLADDVPAPDPEHVADASDKDGRTTAESDDSQP